MSLETHPASVPCAGGATVWLTGLPGAGNVKGLYARRRAGTITGLTGVDDEYQTPQQPDLVIPTHEHTVEESVAALIDHLVDRGIVERPPTTLRGVAEPPQGPSTDEYARTEAS